MTDTIAPPAPTTDPIIAFLEKQSQDARAVEAMRKQADEDRKQEAKRAADFATAVSKIDTKAIEDKSVRANVVFLQKTLKENRGLAERFLSEFANNEYYKKEIDNLERDGAAFNKIVVQGADGSVKSDVLGLVGEAAKEAKERELVPTSKDVGGTMNTLRMARSIFGQKAPFLTTLLDHYDRANTVAMLAGGITGQQINLDEHIGRFLSRDTRAQMVEATKEFAKEGHGKALDMLSSLSPRLTEAFSNVEFAVSGMGRSLGGLVPPDIKQKLGGVLSGGLGDASQVPAGVAPAGRSR